MANRFPPSSPPPLPLKRPEPGMERLPAGDRWCERIWTVIATCAQQGRSVFAYLEAAVGGWFEGTKVPSLLPEG